MSNNRNPGAVINCGPSPFTTFLAKSSFDMLL